ncbi:hypothetical protein [Variovorax sp. RCC_210]|jgi:hypothetical protein|uniref:hypothetical protein n=1 Tax=Variovorax sp. RCC_210 TaxID=3239217 RepID=UPI000D5DB97E
MCLEFLQQLSHGKAPRTLTEPDEINTLLVLRAAGYVAAFTLRSSQNGESREWGRFLAITPRGREALAESASEAN